VQQHARDGVSAIVVNKCTVKVCYVVIYCECRSVCVMSDSLTHSLR